MNPQDNTENVLSNKPPTSQAHDGMDGDDPFKNGSVIEGKFEVLEILGKGGMGAVYRAKQLLLNTDVALKTLNAGLASDATAMRRFQTEARAAFSLKHRNLVDVHDFGLFGSGHPFIVMELIEGSTLQEILKRRGTLPVNEAEALFVQLCHGLGYAHQNGVVHRDIKPGNIMLLKDKDVMNEVAVKILDFGIAKIVNSLDTDAEALTKTGELFGSPLYMSPEQCSGGAIDKRSDIYSLGCVFFESLTGTPPFVGANPLRTMMLHQAEKAPTLKEAAMGKEFPAYLERILGRMLSKEPSRRYQDLSEVSREIISNAHASSGQTASSLPNLFETMSTKLDTANGLSNSGKVTVSWLQLLLVAIPLVGISVAAGFWLHRTTQPAANNPTPPSAEVPRESGLTKTTREAGDFFGTNNDKAKVLFAKAKPIVKTEIQPKDGVKQWSISFPSIPMGKVVIDFFSDSDKRIEVNAIDNVIVPQDAELTFVLVPPVQPEVPMNSYIFDKIAPNIFTGLAVLGQEGAQIYTLVTEDKEQNLMPGIEHLMRDAAHWTQLSEVTFFQTQITKDVVNSLKGIDKLSGLALRNCTIGSTDIYDPSLLKRLKIMKISRTEADPICNALAGSKKLHRFEIGDECSISTKAIEALGACPNLEYMTFDFKKMPPELVASAVKLKSIKMIGFNPQLVNYQLRETLQDANFKLFRTSRDFTVFVRQ